MKKLTTILFLLIACISVAFAQSVTDTIHAKKVSGGFQFYKNGTLMTMPKLDQTLKTNEEAYKMFKAAKSSGSFASVLSGIGGGLVGWPLGTALAGGDAVWSMAIIGAGLIIVAIPLSSSSVKKYKSAVDIYNGGLKSTSFLEKTEFNFCISGSGVGLVMRF